MNHDVVWYHYTRLDVAFNIIYRFAMIHQLFALMENLKEKSTSRVFDFGLFYTKSKFLIASLSSNHDAYIKLYDNKPPKYEFDTEKIAYI